MTGPTAVVACGGVAESQRFDRRHERVPQGSGVRRRRSPAWSRCTSARRTPSRPRRSAWPRRSTSASGSTIAGFWPPISACTAHPARRGRERHLATDHCGPGERHDVGLGHDRPAGLAVTGKHGEQPVGQYRGEQGGQPQRRGRRLRRRLEHDGVAERQRRRGLPDRDGDREVPRGDEPGDAARPAPGVEQPARPTARASRRPGRTPAGRSSAGWPPPGPPRRGPRPRGLPTSRTVSPVSSSAAAAIASAAADSACARAAARAAPPTRLGGAGARRTPSRRLRRWSPVPRPRGRRGVRGVALITDGSSSSVRAGSPPGTGRRGPAGTGRCR